MDLETTKQIVDLLKTVSGDATQAIITYFIMVGVLPLLKTIVSWGGGYLITRLLLTTLQNMFVLEKGNSRKESNSPSDYTNQ